ETRSTPPRRAQPPGDHHELHHQLTAGIADQWGLAVAGDDQGVGFLHRPSSAARSASHAACSAAAASFHAWAVSVAWLAASRQRMARSSVLSARLTAQPSFTSLFVAWPA